MNYRMNKYYEETDNTSSRYKKNENLYREITKNEIDNYDIKSNATVIAENNNEIDIEKIKRILDTKYKEAPKRRSIRIEEEEEVRTPQNITETTKEYDINVILEKAREQKRDNYEEERLKRIKETEYNILNNLDVVKKEAENELEKNDISEVTHVSKNEETSDELKDLINTIALNETKSINTSNEEVKNEATDDALDILSDLKGDDDTEVLDGLKEEIESINTEAIKITNEDIEESKEDLTSTNMINSFYTSSNQLKETDFEDMDDFSKGIESGNGFVKIIIAIIIIAVIIGLVLLFKTLFF